MSKKNKKYGRISGSNFEISRLKFLKKQQTEIIKAIQNKLPSFDIKKYLKETVGDSKNG